MPPHDPIVVDGADNSALASVVSAAVIMNVNTGVEMEPVDKALTIEKRVEINPNVTVRRPWPSGRKHWDTVSAEIVFDWLQMFTQPCVPV